MTELSTFRLPGTVTGSDDDVDLGRRLVAAWQADGILQIATDAVQDRKTQEAMAASRRFFHGLSLEEKSRLVSDLTYAGYIASGEEVTDGIADYSEIFTVCKDVPLDDSRVVGNWPCHGPVPWPDNDYRDAMREFMAMLGEAGEKIVFPGDILQFLTGGKLLSTPHKVLLGEDVLHGFDEVPALRVLEAPGGRLVRQPVARPLLAFDRRTGVEPADVVLRGQDEHAVVGVGADAAVDGLGPRHALHEHVHALLPRPRHDEAHPRRGQAERAQRTPVRGSSLLNGTIRSSRRAVAR
jgi:hypothetical protein